MNRNEFETWMKDQIEEQPFSPKEDGWLKLQADLQKAAPQKKILVFLPWMKATAAVIAIILLGVSTRYFIRHNEQENAPFITAKKAITIPEQTTTQEADISKIATNNTAQKKGYSTVIPTKTILKQEPLKASQNNILPTTKEENIFTAITKTENTVPKNNLITTPANKNDYLKNAQNSYPDPYIADNTFYPKSKASTQTINMGMNANIGSSTVSNIAYQFGIVGRGNISKLIFVEAGISLASNMVNSSSNHAFSSIEYGTVGNEIEAITSTTNVEADYSRNIISIGFNPSIGIKASSRLSVSAGGALNRNLNPSLTLNNRNDIQADAFSKDIISTSQSVTNWDIGLTCNADYKVTKNLSFNINYRKGLSDYLQQNNKYLKNSGVQLGLKFLFGK